MSLIAICNGIIRYSFYALFFLVPLVVTNNTSELFELNKMWLTYGLTIIIVAAWGAKAVREKKLEIQRTPLDIPILLFLLASIISTLFSLDHRVSIWGYYSRFNGGLLSIMTYILLYYAFVSNFKKTAGDIGGMPGIQMVKRILMISLLSGTIVALWGLPSHFGKDPTCLLFRGTLDVSCWTESFQPTVRIFSTIGQPAWLAAYLAILLPISMAYFLREVFKRVKEKSNPLLLVVFVALITLFYIDLIFANTRAGFLGFWAANGVFWVVLFLRKLFPKDMFLRLCLLINGIFLVLTFFLGTPIAQINQLTFPSLQNETTSQSETSEENIDIASSPTPAPPIGEFAGTDSGTIRLYVWQGAIDAWKAHPLFGTGVETFAFAYYKHRPVGHNLTSEWDYLYNKAHNEYLNYLTTTGIFGLGSYLAIIGLFGFFAIRKMLLRQKIDSSQHHALPAENSLFSISLIAAFISILVTNFFGFSVVIVNVYFFLIPAFVFIFENLLVDSKSFVFPRQALATNLSPKLSLYQQSFLLFILLFAGYLLLGLLNSWRADVAYAYGFNLDRVNEYQQAYPYLQKAVNLRSSEPLFQDELALNTATLATAFFNQKDATASDAATQLVEQATALSNTVVENNPNNIVYWKNRVRIFYTLAQIDSRYYSISLDAMQKARSLAPTDAKVLYNLAVLHGQIGQAEEGIRLLDQVIRMKPNYADAYFARGLFYHSLATDDQENVIKPEFQEKAVSSLEHILNNINSADTRTIDTLTEWEER